jgi:hypothetical protein
MLEPTREDLLERARQIESEKQEARLHPSQPVGDLSALLAEPLTMPGEGEVWVHPISLEEDMWAVAQAGAEVRELKLKDLDQARHYIQMRANVYHVIAACRRGQAADAPRVYTVEDAKRLRTNPAYRKKILQAVAISDRLGGEDWTREAFDSFFNGIQGRLNGLLSQSKGDSVSISRRDLEAFVSWLSLIRQRAVLSVEEMPDLGPAEAAPDGAMPVN